MASAVFILSLQAKRATEFVKQDALQVSIIELARQGAFYILPKVNNAGDEAYGGVNDYSTL